VEGSITGEDGKGFIDERFVSRSGCVVIDPADWHLAWCLSYKKLRLPDGFQIKWKTYPQFTTKYAPQAAGIETVLVQNCANGTHQLTLRGSADRSGITALRVYAPAAVPDLALAVIEPWLFVDRLCGRPLRCVGPSFQPGGVG
jgi:hypothetical protein